MDRRSKTARSFLPQERVREYEAARPPKIPPPKTLGDAVPPTLSGLEPVFTGWLRDTREIQNNPGQVTTLGHRRRRGRTYRMDWVRDDRKVESVIQRAFPKLRSDGEQYRIALDWMAVIYWYYRLEMTSKEVADTIVESRYPKFAEAPTTSKRFDELVRYWQTRVEGIARDIRQFVNGERRDDRARTGRPRGRPRKPAAHSSC